MPGDSSTTCRAQEATTTTGRLTRLYSASAHHLVYAWNATDTISTLSDIPFAPQSAGFTYDSGDRLTGVAKSGDNQTFSLDPSVRSMGSTR